MPAVVRVKRHIDEEPLSALVLNGKRRCIEQDNAASSVKSIEEISTLLKFAGTIEKQDNTATKQFACLTKEEAKKLVLHKSPTSKEATAKTRQESRQHRHEQRFRVVNCLRTTLKDKNKKVDKITIVDIEKHSTNYETVDNSKNQSALARINEVVPKLLTSEPSTSAVAAAAAGLLKSTDSDKEYVYDLYIPENIEESNNIDLMDDNNLSACAFDNFVYEDENDDEYEYDSEDSNGENFYANEYPDEDTDDTFDSDNDEEDDYESGLTRALNRCVLSNDDSDPHSDSIDSEEDGDVDINDVNRFGLRYARYKARLLNKLEENTSNSDSDDVEEPENECSDTDEDDDEVALIAD